MRYLVHVRQLIITTLSLVSLASASSSTLKPWNWMVYMCNNNNLHRYGVQNLRQMVSVGSSNHINILLQMDHFGEKEISRFYIEKNNAVISQNIANSFTSYSGTPQNLLDFAKWGITNYPSQKHCLVLWNHGAGIKDPSIWGRMMIRWRDELYNFNPTSGLLELNRKIKLPKEENGAPKERGIAFNDTAEEYLTNQDLKTCLETIKETLLGGNKLDILAMDACHMSMIEIASQVKHGAKYMVASAEVEPGSGYNYHTVLNPFATTSCNEKELAAHIVSSYQKEYKGTLADFTQTALDLSLTSNVEREFDVLCGHLIAAFEKDAAITTKILKTIRSSRSSTTEYYDCDYIDMGHFLKSLVSRAHELSTGKFDWNLFGFFSSNESIPSGMKAIWGNVERSAHQVLSTLNRMIIASAVGRNFSQASGVGIYFPTTSIHASYFKTEFARSTRWPNVLAHYLKNKKQVLNKHKIKQRAKDKK